MQARYTFCFNTNPKKLKNTQVTTGRDTNNNNNNNNNNNDDENENENDEHDKQKNMFHCFRRSRCFWKQRKQR